MELERRLEGSSAPGWAWIKKENFFDWIFSLIDRSSFQDKEIVKILWRTVDSSLSVNLKTPDTSGVNWFNSNNTDITETSTAFNEFRQSEKNLSSI